MRSSAEQGWAVDTSVAVAFLDEGHSAHQDCVAALAGRDAALAGHAAFETYSVLTRLPGSIRVLPLDARQAMEAAFPEACWLSPDAQQRVFREVAGLGITGGAVYDALVGSAARSAGRILLTRDHRARVSYDLLGVTYQMV